MGHVVHLQSREQHVQALRVLDKMPGTWQMVRGPDGPVMLLTEAHYKALVKAGVVPGNDKEVKPRGKKAPAKKAKS